MKREFRRDGLGYLEEFSELGPGSDRKLRLRVDHLQRREGNLWGELFIDWLDYEPSHVLRDRVNLSLDSSRERLAKTLAARFRDLDLPWLEMIEDFAVSTLLKDEEGEPVVEVGGLEEAFSEEDEQIAGVLPYGKATLAYGHGGSCKGYLVVSMAVCIATGRPWMRRKVRTGRVLYLDWEDDPRIADRRIKQVARGMEMYPPPRLFYRNCKGPLRMQIHEVARQVTTLAIDVVIIDSAFWAIGSGGEWAKTTDMTAAFYEGLKHLGKTAVVIDHVSKATAKDKSEGGTPYGDVNKWNAARCAWEVIKDQDFGSRTSEVGLYHRKGNHSQLQHPIGVQLEFLADQVLLREFDVSASTALSTSLTIPQRLEALLRANGPLLVKDLGEMMDTTPETIRTKLNMLRKRGRTTTLPDGRWVLADGGPADGELGGQPPLVTGGGWDD